jgi:uncharacterized protein (TIGR02145 family)
LRKIADFTFAIYKGNGNDDFGFTALPGSYRGGSSGSFDNVGDSGYWWSSSPYNEFPWSRHLNYVYSEVYRGDNGCRYGLSVRCIKD